MNLFHRWRVSEDESLQAMREREKLVRLPLFFKGMLMFMGTIFAVEIVYFSMGINTTRKFCDELRAVSLSADHQRNVSLDVPSTRQEAGLPIETANGDDTPLSERMVRVPVPDTWQSILRSRDPFSDTTYAEGERRRREQAFLLAKQNQKNGFYSILRDTSRSDTNLYVNEFAYLIQNKPPLPPPDLENIRIEGVPPELSSVSPAKAVCRFTWKGTLSRNDIEYYFVGDDKSTYSARVGESIEGYHLQAKEKSSLVLMKDGDAYPTKKRSPL
jgi:hypothetical protein